MRKLLENKLYSRILMKGINTRAVHLIRYSGLFLKLTREEFQKIDQIIRKLMTMHKALHPRDDIDYMCQEKKILVGTCCHSNSNEKPLTYAVVRNSKGE